MEATIDNAMILTRTGRELGPDFMLKVEVPEFTAGSVINSNSNITEVLNIVGYLCNTSRKDDSTINVEGSLDTTTYGEHDASGIYVNSGVGAVKGTLYASSSEAPLFMLDKLTAAVPTVPAVIPQGILTRTRNDEGLHTVKPPVAIQAADAGQTEINALMSDCVKQMIHILENTRKIFGPKGWTALFNTVKGGASSSAAKRTNRHRRK